MTSDEDIIAWVEDNYDPDEFTPEEFIRQTTFSGKRLQVALKAVRKIAEEAGAVPPTEVERPGPSLFSRIANFFRRLFGL